MYGGYVRVAAASPKVTVGGCDKNADEIIGLMKKAAKAGAQIVLFPELSVTGYTCGDLFGQGLIIEKAASAVEKIALAAGALGIVAIVGAPVMAAGGVYNCAVVLGGGAVIGAVPKSFICGRQGEMRNFAAAESAPQFVKICGRAAPFGEKLIFGEGDAVFAVEIGGDLHSPLQPGALHSLAGANIIFNLAADEARAVEGGQKNDMILHRSLVCAAGYVHASAGFGESTTDAVYLGGAVIAENGEILAAAGGRGEAALAVSEIDVMRLRADRQRAGRRGLSPEHLKEYRFIGCPVKKADFNGLSRKISKTPFLPQDEKEKALAFERAVLIQKLALSKRLSHTGIKRVVIGISGGLDSALALLICAFTFDFLNLPRENITGVSMPGLGTGARTRKNAAGLMKALGVSIREIDIKNACLEHFKVIGHSDKLYDITYENTQARERSKVLMNMANFLGALVVGTGNMSELALGWTTYGGDHISMYGINLGLSKTFIKELLPWISENMLPLAATEVISDILKTPVSPELLPPGKDGETAQKTEDTVGPYEVQDFYLYYTLRYGYPPARILFLAENAFSGEYSPKMLKEWLKIFYTRFFANQFKRSCLPDGPRVMPVSLSPRGGWHMPSDADAGEWIRELDKI